MTLLLMWWRHHSLLFMNKSVIGVIELAFASMIFLAALVYMIYQTTDIAPAFDEIAPSQATVYSIQRDIPNEEDVAWTGAQVVGKLYRLTEDDVEIRVNGVSFRTDADVIRLGDTINKYSKYTQSVSYDTNGKMTMIDFTTIY